MIVETEQGLYCPEGGFHLDPLLPVERAVLTHAHGDHARAGSASYLCTPESAALLRRRLEGARVETVNAFADDGSLHPLQQELIERGAVQCGFCTPGVVLGSIEAVRLGLAGDRMTIRRSLAGNLCRCTGYGKIVEAVEAYRDGEGAA